MDNRKALTAGVREPQPDSAIDRSGTRFTRARHGPSAAKLVPRRLLIAALAIALLGGCATTRWMVLKQFRHPGESIQALPDDVWAEYDCASQKLPLLVIERNELSPVKVSPGSDFGHRLVYVMCPARPTEVVEGELSTRIRFKGSPIVEQLDSHFEFKPGRWVIDAIVHLPEQAEAGVYAYELDFDSKTLEFHKSLTFVVVKR